MFISAPFGLKVLSLRLEEADPYVNLTGLFNKLA